MTNNPLNSRKPSITMLMKLAVSAESVTEKKYFTDGTLRLPHTLGCLSINGVDAPNTMPKDGPTVHSLTKQIQRTNQQAEDETDDNG